MTRTVTVTGGFSGAAVIDVSDSQKQLADSTFAVALTDVGAELPPVVGSGAWVVAPTTPSAAAAVVSIVVDDDTEPGNYNAAVDVQRDGRHEVVWALDRRGRRALVVVK